MGFLGSEISKYPCMVFNALDVDGDGQIEFPVGI